MNGISELENLKKALSKDIKNYGDNICKFLAQDIADELTHEAKTSIELFYGSYDPKYYYRHNNFYRSYRRDYKNRNPRFYGGVELLMDGLPNVYSGTNSDPYSVFWRVYSGYHGIASFQGRAPIMTPAPINRILDKREEIIAKQDIYVNKADEKAKQQKYNILFQ